MEWEIVVGVKKGEYYIDGCLITLEIESKSQYGEYFSIAGCKFLATPLTWEKIEEMVWKAIDREGLSNFIADTFGIDDELACAIDETIDYDKAIDRWWDSLVFYFVGETENVVGTWYFIWESAGQIDIGNIEDYKALFISEELFKTIKEAWRKLHLKEVEDFSEKERKLYEKLTKLLEKEAEESFRKARDYFEKIEEEREGEE